MATGLSAMRGGFTRTDGKVVNPACSNSFTLDQIRWPGDVHLLGILFRHQIHDELASFENVRPSIFWPIRRVAAHTDGHDWRIA